MGPLLNVIVLGNWVTGVLPYKPTGEISAHFELLLVPSIFWGACFVKHTLQGNHQISPPNGKFGKSSSLKVSLGIWYVIVPQEATFWHLLFVQTDSHMDLLDFFDIAKPPATLEISLQDWKYTLVPTFQIRQIPAGILPRFWAGRKGTMQICILFS